MEEWPIVEDLIREVFEGTFLTYSDAGSISADQLNFLILAEVSVDPVYPDEYFSPGAMIYGRDIQATMLWIAKKDDSARVASAIRSAYHKTGELLVNGRFGSDVISVKRTAYEAEQHAEQVRLLAGTEIWTFGK